MEKKYPFADWTTKVSESEIRRLLKYNVKYYFGGGKPGALPLSTFTRIIGSIVDHQNELLSSKKPQAVVDAYNYGPTQGLSSLRNLLGKRMQQRDQIPYPGNNPGDGVIITTGSQQALYAVLDVLINPGDVILTSKPAYLGFLGPATKLGANIIGVPTDMEGLIPEYITPAIEQAQKLYNKTPKLLYIVPDSDNPKGTTLPEKRRKEIYELAVTHDFLIIEDAPYKEIQFDGVRYPPIKSYDDENSHVVYLCSTSKEAAVFRIGYSMVPLPILDNMQKLRGYLDLCPSTFNQLIIEEYYRTYIDDVLPQNLEIYKNRCQAMCAAMDATFPSGIRSSPTGGFFVWWESNGKIDTSKFLMEVVIPNNIIYTSGAAFYPTTGSSLNPDSHLLEPTLIEHNTMRLSFSYLKATDIDEGIRRLGNLLTQYFHKA